MGRIEVGDLVVRLSHGSDIIFKVTEVTADGMYVLKGLHLRLLADAPRCDLALADARLLRDEIVREEAVVRDAARRIFERRSRQREERMLLRGPSTKKYGSFDLPGRVLHLDGDAEYLRMCLKTYRQLRIEAIGRCVDEEDQPALVDSLLREHRPDILVLTGHDAILGGRKKLADITSYRNSRYFIEGVRKARLFEPSRDELVIFAGACQSHFEAILAAGANYASAPNRIFIHAYDPVFIAEKVAFTSIGRTVDISDAIGASVTGAEGVGGIETRGKLRIGMPTISHHS
ncbi:MAG: sporulation peptidase YabG [Selenomonadales bacterium]|nr:sporulation peptidase YabG [Selenomonadales bacterium]